MTFQDGTHIAGKVLPFIPLLFFFGFVALHSLPQTPIAEEPSISMAVAPSITQPLQQPARAWQSMRTSQPFSSWQPSGQFMQPVQARNSQSASAFRSSEPEQGRRGTMAAFFGLAAAAANNRAANANVYVGTPQVPGLENKLGSTATTPKDSPKDQKFNADDSPANDELPPAGDYTRFDAKVYKQRNPLQEGGKTKTGKVELAGTGEAPAAVIPGVLAVAALTAGVPAFLSPGEEAFKAQRAGEKGQRVQLKKNRDKLQKEGKKQWWGAGFASKKN